eukprot:4805811-Pyramimonas_sp.AAC.1
MALGAPTGAADFFVRRGKRLAEFHSPLGAEASGVRLARRRGSKYPARSGPKEPVMQRVPPGAEAEHQVPGPSWGPALAS